MTKSFSLRKLKQRDWAIVCIVLSIVAAILWYFYMYGPTQERIAQLESDITRLDADIRRGEDARRNLPNLRLAVAELEADRRDFLSQLPRESDIAGLIDSLRANAQQSDVVIRSFSQGSAQESIQDVRPIGFTIDTQGTYGETMDYLSRLEAMRRFAKIGRVSLDIEDNTSSDPNLNASFAFTVYVFTGSDPGEQ
ncbi:MAG: type 4a pilus biogenesis protein PilO [Trueperaceae bacterium]|nr:type 4a pilus biogenesis protein PilO [Trueperaceae bacterium]MCC6310500.1 type 4a pilus biogenesis protein PilO [Trueperaceae bacterium]MCO5174230.1 type 4a pilus biogenesis protein PilO [Trueperaceae bacterium]MCW5819609.1 type 4a pilus biogenesis protein PilO [Trueperaceae bacterium]